jgi:Tfp pilus assembly protein PilF
MAAGCEKLVSRLSPPYRIEITGMADRSGNIGVREFKRAVESIQRGEFGKAEKILPRITAREPRNFSAHHMLGIVSTELNKLERAEKFFKTSLSINARYHPLYKDYGTSLSRAKQFDKTISPALWGCR